MSIVEVIVPNVLEGEDGEHQRRPPTSHDVENNAAPCEVDTEYVLETNKVTEPRLQSDEAMEQAQRYPTIAKEGNDLMGSGADDEVVREVVAYDITVVENGKEADADDALVDHDNDWFGSGADEDVLREEVAEKNMVEMGNNEPSTIVDPIVVRMSLLDHEDDDWLGSDADEEDMSKEVAEVNETIMQQSDAINLTNYADNSFIDA